MAINNKPLNEIDCHFATFICRLAGTDDRFLWIAAALASQAVASGNICLDLAAAVAGDLASEQRIDDAEDWAARLRTWPVVGGAGQFTPLILDSANRLYLHRYWRYEQELAAAILRRGAEAPAAVDEALLRNGMARLFPGEPASEPDWQRIAALAAVSRKFCVISGGPGTGKTSTVVKILALLLEQAGDNPCRIALAAPTGKAAARLKESIRDARQVLACAAAVRARIPEEVATLHRLLGFVRGSSRFRYNRQNPLLFDLVVVDEASMVSLPLMAKLVGALHDSARLILLGDRDQLASVEAGAILGDICDTGAVHGFSGPFVSLAAAITGATLPAESSGATAGSVDAIVVLRKSYRFAAGSGIDALGRLVNSGAGAAALDLLRGKSHADIALIGCPPPEKLVEALAETVSTGYTPYLRSGDAAEAIALFGRFRILCALRQGPYGVEMVNRLVETILCRAGFISPRRGRWYAGQPVMITKNDYTLQLFNGDLGLILADPAAGNELRAFFPAIDGGLRTILPLRLPEHETAYAMTVHKSQGSEFERILFLLPDRRSEVLSRELMYTAISRAKAGIELWAADDVFLAAVEHRIERKSGLREILWG